MTAEAQNGDGLTLGSGDGSAQLLVFGSHILDGDFADEVQQRMEFARQDGWVLSYSSVKPAGASFSGTRGDRILYLRAVALCEAAAGFLQIDYPARDRKRFDAVVARLVKSLRPRAVCPSR